MSRTDWSEAEANRLAARLARHAGELTTFLWEEGVEATNNAAERALFETIKTLLENAWAGNNPGLLTDVI